MNRNLFYILLLLLCAPFVQVEAQQMQTLYGIGYTAGQKAVPLGNTGTHYGVSSGSQTGASGSFKEVIKDEVMVLNGMPLNVSYFPIVFGDDLFVSKGYFSGYVQLQWKINKLNSRITKFYIYRKPLGQPGDSTLVATTAGDVYAWRDERADKGVLYKYTVFAQGISDKIRMPFINYVESTGFVTATGTVAGRITYEGGTAVEGVNVIAETNGNLSGKSLYLNGTDAYMTLEHKPSDKELELSKGFAFQTWCRFEGTGKGVLFSKGADYEVSYEPGMVSFTVGDKTVTLPYTAPTGEFFHISAIYAPAKMLKLYVHTNAERVDSAVVAAGTTPAPSLENIWMGRNRSDVFFRGHIDEIRLWNRALSYAEVKRDFNRYLTGAESGIVGYWNLNAGVGDRFYDLSRKGFTFYENHGILRRASWSMITPKPNQLAYRGVTDASGNYSIVGFPYETEGSLYTFTPMFGVHKFDPVQALRYVGDGASVHNGIDFKDVSSFPVTGTIRYRHSSFPVEGVSILIDGKPVANSEGLPVTTDKFGRFTVDVPIGHHSVKVSKNQHGFEGDGRFPPKAANGELPLFDFQAPLSGLEFIDSTLVKVAGRVVGGPVEGEKTLGFGKSKNNLGAAKIYLTSEKGYDLTTSDSTLNYTERSIASFASFTTKFVEVRPDVETGEFVTYLPPERYRVTGVTAGNYVFDESFHRTVNLESFVRETEVSVDTLEAKKNGVPLPGYPPYDPTKYEQITTGSKDGITYTLGSNFFKYDARQNFILRVTPTIVVMSQGGSQYFGENDYLYKDEAGAEVTIPLINASGYAFGHPVFLQRKDYTMQIDVFEEYVNNTTSATDRVPVTDGEIKVVNNLSFNKVNDNLELDDHGRAFYVFKAGFPELNRDAVNSANSFTRTLSLTAVTGQQGAIKTIWRENNPFRAYILGAIPTGNDFVTTGPTEVTSILRDPFGSNSYAFLEKGSTSSVSTSYSSTNSITEDASYTVHYGFAKKNLIIGPGAGEQFEFETQNDVTIGLSSEQAWTSEGESIRTISNTKLWSTSGSTDYVGADGDVFIGSATNIVYGATQDLQPVPVAKCETCSDQEVNGFRLGIKINFRIDQDFATSFIYTQSHIRNTLLPNLEKLRNRYLAYDSSGSVPATGKIQYISLVPPTDPRFGSDNHNEEVWGDQAIDFFNEATHGKGPSYKLIIPADVEFITDSVFFYNRAIREWKYWLEENEKRKVKGKLLENISFDAGAGYEKSETVEHTQSSTHTFEWAISPSVATAIGFAFQKTGSTLELSLSYGHSGSNSRGEEVTNSTTYGYALADEDAGDYMSMDVKDAGDGFGPVFYLRGGATSCPYEAGAETEFYKPGSPLADATLAREKVSVGVVQGVVANIPENRAGEFTLIMGNDSETNEDGWYDLKLVDTTNPFGAVLEIDGQPLGNGRSFFIPSGETLQKTLKIRKGSSTVLEYNDLSMVLMSQCDENVSDSVSLSAHFQPGCSDIALSSPKDKWVLNSNTRPVDTLNVVIDRYDLNYGNFKYIRFQYKAASTSQWTTEHVFYNKKQVTQEEFDNADEPKSWVDGPKIQYAFNMHSLPDRAYDIRATSVCVLGPGVEVETPTEILHGIKDVKRPVVFGSPQPGDGILEAGEEIAIQFDEPIEAGLLTPFNFSVKGLLNSYKLNNNTSVTLDGINDYVKIPDGLSLSKSFTIEFWLKRNSTGREGVVFAKGYATEDAVQMGFTPGNKVFIEVGTQRIESVNAFAETDWHHYAVTYHQESKKISVYRDDAYAIDEVVVNKDIAGQGPMVIGKSVTDNRYSDINLHELRVWSTYQRIGQVYAQLYKPMTGDEIGLVGYWPLDEAYGNLAVDKARSRHARIFGDWLVLPRGKAMRFNGASEYVEINTGSTVVITDEMDMTLEFWFKGATGQTNATLFSSGKGDGFDAFNRHNLSVNINADGKLEVLSNGQVFTINGEEDNFMDDNWHHFAMVLQRNANTTMYVDGTQKATFNSASLSGLSGARMWIGARGYKESSMVTKHDQFFNGQIDEFRIWRLARKQNQIVMDRNAKLKGDEAGLVAYYPFERYETVSGVKLMAETLADQWQNPYGPNGGMALATGASFSSDAPNIKDARPVTTVDFDWATNNDKIIITPSAALAGVIEKTVLEITVSDVEDKYENRLASPVTWTAYVDKNPLKWDNDNLALEKKLYDPKTFTVNIINKGGTQQNYYIKNLPPWLTAQPSSGVIAPLATIKITFTINEGVNTGYFSEDIYLKGDFGFDEKLHLDLRVFTPEPAWTVDASKFQYSMNVIGLLKIEGIISTDANDKVGAFVNNECRGVANLRYIEEFDMYQAYLDIYSNKESGEAIELRIWDASRGTEHRDVTPNYVFLSNALKGEPSSPEIIEAGSTIVRKVVLESGWNLVSFNLKTDALKNVNTLLNTLSPGTGDQIKGQSVVDVFTEGIGWTGSLTNSGGFGNGKMYMVKLKNAGSFEIKGVPVDPSIPIAIRAGWNWIGVNPQFNMSVNEALASLPATNGDIVKGKRSFAIYQKGLGWIGSLNYLAPGEGYLLRSATTGNLVYPETTSLSAGRKRGIESEKQYWPVDHFRTQNNMTLVARIESDVMSKLVVGAFAGEKCVGFAEPVQIDEAHAFYFLTLQGEEQEQIAFKAMNMETGEVIPLQQRVSFQANGTEGTFADPYLLSFGENMEVIAEASVKVYPNPFRAQLTVALPDMMQEYVLTISDLAGRTLKTISVPAGSDKVELKEEEHGSLTPGVYLLEIKGGLHHTVIKIIKN